MNLEGKTCGNCEKGKWHKFQDEVEAGIRVEAFKCDNCGNVSYNEAIMEKLEAMNRHHAEERSLIKIGSSLALSIPKNIVKKLRLKPKEKVYVTSEGNKIIAKVAQG